MRHPSNKVEYFLMDIIDASSFTLNYIKPSNSLTPSS